MRLFDCTLRDGANVVGNGFDALLTESIIKNLLSCGIEDIEFGNAKGLGAYELQNAKAPLSDLEYLKLAGAYANKGNLGMFLQAKYADRERVRMAAEHGMHFLRIGIEAGSGEKALPAVAMVKEAGMYCRYSQMKAYICTPEELAEEAAMLEREGVDAITIMDSAGTMLPDEVAAYVSAMAERVSIPVGFHGHNNLGLSVANALAAMEAGAKEIDCGLLGMARSAGNCATELAASVLCRKGILEKTCLFKLLAYLNKELIPAMEKYSYHTAVTPDALVLGLSGCHSAFFGRFQKVAREENVELYPLIMAVSEMDKSMPTEDFIRRIAEMGDRKL